MIIEKPRGYDAATRYEVLTARKAYYCDWQACPIKPGDRYLVLTAFPGDESGYASSAGHPIRWRYCAEHAPKWSHWALPESHDSETPNG